MHLAAEHDLLAGFHAVRDQVESAERLEAHVPAYPGGKESERESVRRRDRQRRPRTLAHGPRVAACPMQAAHQVVSQRLEIAARRRQGSPLGAPHEERSAYPILQCADAPAEGRLRHVASVRRARKVLLLRQRQKVLEPVQIHDDTDPA